MSRYARRTDADQSTLVALARQLGCLVVVTHTVGGTCPDFWIWQPSRQRWLAIEDKSKGGRLTPGQREVQLGWPGAVQVVWSVDEFLSVLGVETC